MGHKLSLEPNGLAYWSLGWSCFSFLLTLLWRALLTEGYRPEQLKRISATYFQDLLLSIFMASLGAVLVKADCPYSIAYPVGLLLPIATLWFTLETKLLTHLWTGTPFHPSWAVPKNKGDPVTPRYSTNNLVNWTFSLATTLITAILTSYAAYAVLSAVGGLNPEGETWKLVAAHGSVFVLHSGLWMIIASSGVPRCSNDTVSTYMPPPIPAVLKCNPHSCIPVHKADLSFGLLLMTIAGMTDVLNNPAATPENVWMALGVAWAATGIAKLAVHTGFL